MDNKHLTRAKDRATGEWVVGYYIGESGGDAYIIEPSAVKYDVGSIDTCPVHECDPKAVGSIAPRQDADGGQVFEGDIIEFETITLFLVRAVVKFGEYKQDGSRGEYAARDCYGWHIEVITATPPEWDDEAEYPEYEKTCSILEIPSFMVVGNQWDNPEMLCH